MAKTTIRYNSQDIVEVANPVNVTMKTEGKNMLTDVTVSGTSELPDGGEVGQVLTKTSSGCEWATGGGGVFAVPIDVNYTSETATTTVTCGELVAAVEHGQAVIVIENDYTDPDNPQKLGQVRMQSYPVSGYYDDELGWLYYIEGNHSVGLYYIEGNHSVGFISASIFIEDGEEISRLSDSDPLHIVFNYLG